MQPGFPRKKKRKLSSVSRIQNKVKVDKKTKQEQIKQIKQSKQFLKQVASEGQTFAEEWIFDKVVAGQDPLYTMIQNLYGYCPEEIKNVIVSLSGISIYCDLKKGKEEQNCWNHPYKDVYNKPITPDLVKEIELQYLQTRAFTHFLLVKLKEEDCKLYAKFLVHLEKHDCLPSFAHLLKKDRNTINSIRNQILVEKLPSSIKKMLQKEISDFIEDAKDTFRLFFTFLLLQDPDPDSPIKVYECTHTSTKKVDLCLAATFENKNTSWSIDKKDLVATQKEEGKPQHYTMKLKDYARGQEWRNRTMMQKEMILSSPLSIPNSNSIERTHSPFASFSYIYHLTKLLSCRFDFNAQICVGLCLEYLYAPWIIPFHCEVCEKLPTKPCTGCCLAFYCSQECQKKDLERHRKIFFYCGANY